MDEKQAAEIGVPPIEIAGRTNFRTDSLDEYPSLSAPGLKFCFGCTANHKNQDVILGDKEDTGSSSFFCKECGGITVLQIREE